jgi:ABC-type multidrug transport system fused ATPase/permease subunit
VPEAPRHRTTFRRLLGFLRPYKWSLVVSSVLAVGSQLAAIAITFLIRAAINGPLTDGSLDGLWLIVALVLGIGLMKSALMLGRRLIAGRQALGAEFDIRNALYAKLVRQSFGYFDRNQTGQLMSRATVDLQSVRFFLGYGLIFFFQHIVTVVVVTTVLFIVDWQLALVALWIMPVLIALAYRYSHISHPVLREVQQKMADVATVSEENIVGVHVVKSFAQE